MNTADPNVIVNNLGTLAKILQSVGILLGVGMFLSGLFHLKKYGEGRTMMSQQHSLATPIFMIIAGTALMLLPTTINTFLNAFWSTTSPLQYDTDGEGWDEYVPVIVTFVRLIGVGSFIRGLVLFSRAGGHQSQPGTMSKAIIHIFAGILCVHVIGTTELLKTIFDIH